MAIADTAATLATAVVPWADFMFVDNQFPILVSQMKATVAVAIKFLCFVLIPVILLWDTGRMAKLFLLLRNVREANKASVPRLRPPASFRIANYIELIMIIEV